MNNRLKTFRESITDKKGKKYSQTRFAEEMHITRDILANYENGRVEMTPLFVDSLCKKYNLNESWLRTGEGEMFAPMTKESEIAQIAVAMFKEELPSTIKALIKVLIDMNEDEVELFDKLVRTYIEMIAKGEKENLPD